MTLLLEVHLGQGGNVSSKSVKSVGNVFLVVDLIFVLDFVVEGMSCNMIVEIY